MTKGILLSLQNDSVIFPLQKDVHTLRVVQDGIVTTMDSVISDAQRGINSFEHAENSKEVIISNVFCAQAGAMALKKMLIDDFNHHSSSLLHKEVSIFDKQVFTVNRSSFFKLAREIAWYLDLPLPDRRTKITPSDSLPRDFPLQMPVNADMIWPLDLWSDYLFSALWFSLFEPYFRNQSTPMEYVGNDCRISSSALLIPPFYICDHVTIEDGAIISGAYIGKFSRIGQGCIVRNSILFDSISLPLGTHILMSVIGDGSLINSPIRFSVIGSNVFVGGGVLMTDVLLFQGQKSYNEKCLIETSNGTRFVNSGASVLGCALGDNVKIASGVILKPGITIEAGSRILR